MCVCAYIVGEYGWDFKPDMVTIIIATIRASGGDVMDDEEDGNLGTREGSG